MEGFSWTRQALCYKQLDFSTFQAIFFVASVSAPTKYLLDFNDFQPQIVPTDLQTFMVQADGLILVLQPFAVP